MEKGGALYLNNLIYPFTQGWFVPSLIEIGPVVVEKKILKFVNVFSLFRNYLPLEKGTALHLNKLEFRSPKDALCQVWLKLAQWFLRTWFFLLMYFSNFLNYLPLVKNWAFFRTNLNPINPKILCVKFHWNWPTGSGEEIFKICQCFLQFCNYFPLEKGRVLRLNKHDSPSPKDDLC